MKALRRELPLIISLALLFVLSILFPRNIPGYPSYIDWDTMACLTGLLVITTGLGVSGVFDRFSFWLLKRVKTEKGLAVTLVFMTAFLSMFVTNDIALFITVPLTVSLQRRLNNPLTKLIIFEAIAANVGSALTPIGNPQNLFLWRMWGVSFLVFVVKMLPMFAVLMLVLVLFLWLFFDVSEVHLKEELCHHADFDRRLFKVSFLLLILFVISAELNLLFLMLPVVLVVYFFFYRRVLVRADWLLLLLFAVIFVDFRVIASIPFVVEYMGRLSLHDPKSVFVASALTSQLFSNVPAAVFMSEFSHNWFTIACGVNVGGNGLVWASLANIIALRLSEDRRSWLLFHKYSVVYFLVTAVLVYVVVL